MNPLPKPFTPFPTPLNTSATTLPKLFNGLMEVEEDMGLGDMGISLVSESRLFVCVLVILIVNKKQSFLGNLQWNMLIFDIQDG